MDCGMPHLFLEGNLRNLTAAPGGRGTAGESGEKAVRKLSLSIVYLFVPFAFFSDVYMLKKYYLWAMAL